MKCITSVLAQPDHKLRLRFDDGVEGVVDLSAEVGHGMFSAWRDPMHFASVAIAHNGRSLEWAGGIDLCADALYLEITGMEPEGLFPKLQAAGTHA
jgi:hypothetical protein